MVYGSIFFSTFTQTLNTGLFSQNDGSFDTPGGLMVRTVPLFIECRAGYRALFTECRALFTECRALFTECRALFTECRALFTECRALFTECRALFTESNALVSWWG